MADLFENTILCKNCEKKMIREDVSKNGFLIRSVKCPLCNNRILHPDDLSEFENFRELKSKRFRVKLRFVGNSYAVSIPREIIDFMSIQEKKLNEMVDLCFEDFKRISLNF
jgi:hypothetical protein